MAKKVSNFEVLGRMASENKDIMMAPDVTNMNYNQKMKGTVVSFGVPGNVIGGIFSGEKKAILLMWDMKQFNELKALMESEE